MRAKDIPEFIFRGAVVSVDGVECVIKDFSLQFPAVETPPPGGRFVRPRKVLVLEFNGLAPLQYDAERVQEMPGALPEFVRAGRKIFCRDPVKPGDTLRQAFNGEWEILNFHFEKEPCEKPRLRIVLARGEGENRTVISRPFNARTMTACKEEDDRAPTPVYELQNDLPVKKPFVLKPRG